MSVGDHALFGSNVVICAEGAARGTAASARRKLTIGDKANVLDHSLLEEGVDVGAGALIGTATFVPAGHPVPPNSMHTGNRDGQPVLLREGKSPRSSKRFETDLEKLSRTRHESTAWWLLFNAYVVVSALLFYPLPLLMSYFAAGVGFEVASTLILGKSAMLEVVSCWRGSTLLACILVEYFPNITTTNATNITNITGIFGIANMSNASAVFNSSSIMTARLDGTDYTVDMVLPTEQAARTANGAQPLLIMISLWLAGLMAVPAVILLGDFLHALVVVAIKWTLIGKVRHKVGNASHSKRSAGLSS